jgi:urease accessory protein
MSIVDIHQRQRLALKGSTPLGMPLLGLSLCVLLLSDHPAAAHIVGRAVGFSSGFEHPLTGLDHFLAMLSVGIWGAQMGGRSVWTLPVTFPLIMTLGGIAGMAGLPMPSVELGIALSIMVLGTAIAAAWRPNEFIALALIAVFAVFHGYAHGAELPRAADPANYAAGFVIATGSIHLLGVGVGLLLSKPFGGVLAQILGALITLGGIWFLLA